MAQHGSNLELLCCRNSSVSLAFFSCFEMEQKYKYSSYKKISKLLF